jgi:hypothetical protein
MPEYIVEKDGKEYIESTDTTDNNPTDSENNEGNSDESDSENRPEEIDEKSFFSTIKDDFNNGDFPKISILKFLPPFPAVEAALILKQLSELFKNNMSKLNTYADVYTDVEIKKKKDELEKLEMKGGAFTLEDCSF